MNLSDLIQKLDLKPHPEGGYYRETYRSSGSIPAEVFGGSGIGERNYATGIYFLLTQGNFSAFHRVRQDEMWHFYLGAPIELYEITARGELKHTLIGNNLSEEERPQYLVPGGHWFASRVLPGAGDYALAGCTVSPGFDFADFEMAERQELLRQYPDFHEVIIEFTRN